MGRRPRAGVEFAQTTCRGTLRCELNSLKLQREINTSETTTLQALKKWIPLALASVRTTLHTSMDEAKLELPEAADLIKNLYFVSHHDYQRLDDRYLRLAVASDKKTEEKFFEQMAWLDHAG